MFAAMLILWALQGKSHFHLWLLLSLSRKAQMSHAKLKASSLLGTVQGVEDNPVHRNSQSEVDQS